jgi:hypothetical protein
MAWGAPVTFSDVYKSMEIAATQMDDTPAEITCGIARDRR